MENSDPLKLKKDLNSSQFLSSGMFYGHTMFVASGQKGAKYLCSPVYHCCIQWIQNRLQFEQHQFDSSVKHSPANVIKVLAANFKVPL